MTDEEIGYKRINAGSILFPEYIKLTADKAVWNPYFVDGVWDVTGLFNDLFLNKIIEKIGETGWAIFFTPYQEMGDYIVDIYVDDKSHFNLIVEIIRANIFPEFTLKFWYKGDISAYKSSQ